MSRQLDVVGGLGHSLAQLGGVITRVCAVLRRHRAGSVPDPAPEGTGPAGSPGSGESREPGTGPDPQAVAEADFEVHVQQALRVVRGLPPLHIVDLKAAEAEAEAARAGTGVDTVVDLNRGVVARLSR